MKYLNDDLALKVLKQFDSSVNAALSGRVKTKLNFKADKLDTYRSAHKSSFPYFFSLLFFGMTVNETMKERSPVPKIRQNATNDAVFFDLFCGVLLSQFDSVALFFYLLDQRRMLIKRR